MRVRVWDLPTRVFHWAIVVCFAGAWLTSGDDMYLLEHITFGYSLFGLMVFRILWGFVGTRYARFSDFIKPPAASWRYLRSLVRGPTEHHIGHNPAGGAAILLLILLGLATPVFGFIHYNEWAGEWVFKVHETLATAMLGLIAVHLLGVIIGSWRHKENLVAAMFSGYKPGQGPGIERTYASLAVVMLAALAALWAWSLGSAG